MEKFKPRISESDLIKNLVRAKKVMDKTDAGDYTKGNINENMLFTDPQDLVTTSIETPTPQQNNEGTLVEKVNNSKLPENIKKAMINNPISQVTLNDGIGIDLFKGAKRLIEQENQSMGYKPVQKNENKMVNEGDLVQKLTPIIENIIRKTLDEILDKKLNQLLLADRSSSLNEDLVIKVGSSIFGGKITKIKKSEK
jgi:hypothetical protein